MEKEFNGHIVLIGKADYDSETLARWTVKWLIENKITSDPSLYVCTEIETARASIETPLFEGNPPSLIIVNHIDSDPEVLAFSKFIRGCLPECWIVDLFQDNDQVPMDNSMVSLVKPIHENDWTEFLSHLFFNAATPQYSKAITSQH
jgi:hypothetical protein